MPQTQTRVGGHGWTEFSFNGQRLAWLITVNDSAPAPVDRGSATAIQPLDAQHPVEIVTPAAFGVGTLTLTFNELWNAQVWQTLPGFESTTSLLEVFQQQLSLGAITCRKIIKVPNGPYRAKVYHGCVITDLNEGESISIGTMTLPKTVTIQYTHSTWV